MNIRKIREEHKHIELKYNFDYHNIDILGMQEHIIIQDAKVRSQDNWTKHICNDISLDKRSVCIDIMLNNRSISSLSEIISYTDHILVSTLKEILLLLLLSFTHLQMKMKL